MLTWAKGSRALKSQAQNDLVLQCPSASKPRDKTTVPLARHTCDQRKREGFR